MNNKESTTTKEKSEMPKYTTPLRAGSLVSSLSAPHGTLPWMAPDEKDASLALEPKSRGPLSPHEDPNLMTREETPFTPPQPYTVPLPRSSAALPTSPGGGGASPPPSSISSSTSSFLGRHPILRDVQKPTTPHEDVEGQRSHSDKKEVEEGGRETHDSIRKLDWSGATGSPSFLFTSEVSPVPSEPSRLVPQAARAPPLTPVHHLLDESSSMTGNNASGKLSRLAVEGEGEGRLVLASGSVEGSVSRLHDDLNAKEEADTVAHEFVVPATRPEYCTLSRETRREAGERHDISVGERNSPPDGSDLDGRERKYPDDPRNKSSSALNNASRPYHSVTGTHRSRPFTPHIRYRERDVEGGTAVATLGSSPSALLERGHSHCPTKHSLQPPLTSSFGSQNANISRAEGAPCHGPQQPRNEGSSSFMEAIRSRERSVSVGGGTMSGGEGTIAALLSATINSPTALQQPPSPATTPRILLSSSSAPPDQERYAALHNTRTERNPMTDAAHRKTTLLAVEAGRNSSLAPVQVQGGGMKDPPSRRPSDAPGLAAWQSRHAPEPSRNDRADGLLHGWKSTLNPSPREPDVGEGHPVQRDITNLNNSVMPLRSSSSKTLALHRIPHPNAFFSSVDSPEEAMTDVEWTKKKKERLQFCRLVQQHRKLWHRRIPSSLKLSSRRQPSPEEENVAPRPAPPVSTASSPPQQEEAEQKTMEQTLQHPHFFNSRGGAEGSGLKRRSCINSFTTLQPLFYAPTPDYAAMVVRLELEDIHGLFYGTIASPSGVQGRVSAEHGHQAGRGTLPLTAIKTTFTRSNTTQTALTSSPVGHFGTRTYAHCSCWERPSSRRRTSNLRNDARSSPPPSPRRIAESMKVPFSRHESAEEDEMDLARVPSQPPTDHAKRAWSQAFFHEWLPSSFPSLEVLRLSHLHVTDDLLQCFVEGCFKRTTVLTAEGTRSASVSRAAREEETEVSCTRQSGTTSVSTDPGRDVPVLEGSTPSSQALFLPQPEPDGKTQRDAEGQPPRERLSTTAAEVNLSHVTGGKPHPASLTLEQKEEANVSGDAERPCGAPIVWREEVEPPRPQRPFLVRRALPHLRVLDLRHNDLTAAAAAWLGRWILLYASTVTTPCCPHCDDTEEEAENRMGEPGDDPEASLPPRKEEAERAEYSEQAPCQAKNKNSPAHVTVPQGSSPQSVQDKLLLEGGGEPNKSGKEHTAASGSVCPRWDTGVAPTSVSEATSSIRRDTGTRSARTRKALPERRAQGLEELILLGNVLFTDAGLNTLDVYFEKMHESKEVWSLLWEPLLEANASTASPLRRTSSTTRNTKALPRSTIKKRSGGSNGKRASQCEPRFPSNPSSSSSTRLCGDSATAFARDGIKLRIGEASSARQCLFGIPALPSFTPSRGGMGSMLPPTEAASATRNRANITAELVASASSTTKPFVLSSGKEPSACVRMRPPLLFRVHCSLQFIDLSHCGGTTRGLMHTMSVLSGIPSVRCVQLGTGKAHITLNSCEAVPHTNSADAERSSAPHTGKNPESSTMRHSREAPQSEPPPRFAAVIPSAMQQPIQRSQPRSIVPLAKSGTATLRSSALATASAMRRSDSEAGRNSSMMQMLEDTQAFQLFFPRSRMQHLLLSGLKGLCTQFTVEALREWLLSLWTETGECTVRCCVVCGLARRMPLPLAEVASQRGQPRRENIQKLARPQNHREQPFLLEATKPGDAGLTSEEDIHPAKESSLPPPETLPLIESRYPADALSQDVVEDDQTLFLDLDGSPSHTSPIAGSRRVAMKSSSRPRQCAGSGIGSTRSSISFLDDGTLGPDLKPSAVNLNSSSTRLQPLPSASNAPQSQSAASIPFRFNASSSVANHSFSGMSARSISFLVHDTPDPPDEPSLRILNDDEEEEEDEHGAAATQLLQPRVGGSDGWTSRTSLVSLGEKKHKKGGNPHVLAKSPPVAMPPRSHSRGGGGGSRLGSPTLSGATPHPSGGGPVSREMGRGGGGEESSESPIPLTEEEGDTTGMGFLRAEEAKQDNLGPPHRRREHQTHRKEKSRRRHSTKDGKSSGSGGTSASNSSSASSSLERVTPCIRASGACRQEAVSSFTATMSSSAGLEGGTPHHLAGTSLFILQTERPRQAERKHFPLRTVDLSDCFQNEEVPERAAMALMVSGMLSHYVFSGSRAAGQEGDGWPPSMTTLEEDAGSNGWWKWVCESPYFSQRYLEECGKKPIRFTTPHSAEYDHKTSATARDQHQPLSRLSFDDRMWQWMEATQPPLAVISQKEASPSLEAKESPISHSPLVWFPNGAWPAPLGSAGPAPSPPPGESSTTTTSCSPAASTHCARRNSSISPSHDRTASEAYLSPFLFQTLSRAHHGLLPHEVSAITAGQVRLGDLCCELFHHANFCRSGIVHQPKPSPSSVKKRTATTSPSESVPRPPPAPQFVRSLFAEAVTTPPSNGLTGDDIDPMQTLPPLASPAAHSLPLPPSFTHVHTLRLAHTGLSDHGIRALCLALTSTPSSSSAWNRSGSHNNTPMMASTTAPRVLQRLRVLDVSGNFLTPVGCLRLLETLFPHHLKAHASSVGGGAQSHLGIRAEPLTSVMGSLGGGCSSSSGGCCLSFWCPCPALHTLAMEDEWGVLSSDVAAVQLLRSAIHTIEDQHPQFLADGAEVRRCQEQHRQRQPSLSVRPRRQSRISAAPQHCYEGPAADAATDGASRREELHQDPAHLGSDTSNTQLNKSKQKPQGCNEAKQHHNEDEEEGNTSPHINTSEAQVTTDLCALKSPAPSSSSQSSFQKFSSTLDKFGPTPAAAPLRRADSTSAMSRSQADGVVVSDEGHHEEEEPQHSGSEAAPSARSAAEGARWRHSAQQTPRQQQHCPESNDFSSLPLCGGSSVFPSLARSLVILFRPHDAKKPSENEKGSDGGEVDRENVSATEDWPFPEGEGGAAVENGLPDSSLASFKSNQPSTSSDGNASPPAPEEGSALPRSESVHSSAFLRPSAVDAVCMQGEGQSDVEKGVEPPEEAPREAEIKHDDADKGEQGAAGSKARCCSETIPKREVGNHKTVAWPSGTEASVDVGCMEVPQQGTLHVSGGYLKDLEAQDRAEEEAQRPQENLKADVRRDPLEKKAAENEEAKAKEATRFPVPSEEKKLEHPQPAREVQTIKKAKAAMQSEQPPLTVEAPLEREDVDACATEGEAAYSPPERPELFDPSKHPPFAHANLGAPPLVYTEDSEAVNDKAESARSPLWSDRDSGKNPPSHRNQSKEVSSSSSSSTSHYRPTTSFSPSPWRPHLPGSSALPDDSSDPNSAKEVEGKEHPCKEPDQHDLGSLNTTSREPHVLPLALDEQEGEAAQLGRVEEREADSLALLAAARANAAAGHNEEGEEDSAAEVHLASGWDTHHDKGVRTLPSDLHCRREKLESTGEGMWSEARGMEHRGRGELGIRNGQREMSRQPPRELSAVTDDSACRAFLTPVDDGDARTDHHVPQSGVDAHASDEEASHVEEEESNPEKDEKDNLVSPSGPRRQKVHYDAEHVGEQYEVTDDEIAVEGAQTSSSGRAHDEPPSAALREHLKQGRAESPSDERSPPINSTASKKECRLPSKDRRCGRGLGRDSEGSEAFVHDLRAELQEASTASAKVSSDVCFSAVSHSRSITHEEVRTVGPQVAGKRSGGEEGPASNPLPTMEAPPALVETAKTNLQNTDAALSEKCISDPVTVRTNGGSEEGKQDDGSPAETSTEKKKQRKKKLRRRAAEEDGRERQAAETLLVEAMSAPESCSITATPDRGPPQLRVTAALREGEAPPSEHLVPSIPQRHLNDKGDEERDEEDNAVNHFTSESFTSIPKGEEKKRPKRDTADGGRSGSGRLLQLVLATPAGTLEEEEGRAGEDERFKCSKASSPELSSPFPCRTSSLEHLRLEALEEAVGEQSGGAHRHRYHSASPPSPGDNATLYPTGHGGGLAARQPRSCASSPNSLSLSIASPSHLRVLRGIQFGYECLVRADPAHASTSESSGKMEQCFASQKRIFTGHWGPQSVSVYLAHTFPASSKPASANAGSPGVYLVIYFEKKRFLRSTVRVPVLVHPLWDIPEPLTRREKHISGGNAAVAGTSGVLTEKALPRGEEDVGLMFSVASIPAPFSTSHPPRPGQMVSAVRVTINRRGCTPENCAAVLRRATACAAPAFGQQETERPLLLERTSAQLRRLLHERSFKALSKTRTKDWLAEKAARDARKANGTMTKADLAVSSSTTSSDDDKEPLEAAENHPEPILRSSPSPPLGTRNTAKPKCPTPRVSEETASLAALTRRAKRLVEKKTALAALLGRPVASLTALDLHLDQQIQVLLHAGVSPPSFSVPSPSSVMATEETEEATRSRKTSASLSPHLLRDGSAVRRGGSTITQGGEAVTPTSAHRTAPASASPEWPHQPTAETSLTTVVTAGRPPESKDKEPPPAADPPTARQQKPLHASLEATGEKSCMVMDITVKTVWEAKKIVKELMEAQHGAACVAFAHVKRSGKTHHDQEKKM